jgi:hypothetical protein
VRRFIANSAPKSGAKSPHSKARACKQVKSRGDSWIEKVRQSTEPDAEGWVRVRGLSLTDAQHLLDWLENQGIAARDLAFEPAEGFTVRWRPIQARQGKQGTSQG